MTVLAYLFMDAERKRERIKRYRNRIRIGYILLGLFAAIVVVGFIITGRILLYAGFIIPVGVAYLIAGLWEKKEMKGNI